MKIEKINEDKFSITYFNTVKGVEVPESHTYSKAFLTEQRKRIIDQKRAEMDQRDKEIEEVDFLLTEFEKL